MTGCTAACWIEWNGESWLGDHFIDCWVGDNSLECYTATLDQIPQLSPLGAVFSYCHSGFILARRVIEAVTGSAL